MMERLNNMLLAVTDPILGWLLLLPRDLALLLVAFLTVVLLTAARRWTTDQALLRQCLADKARLKQRLKEAKRKRDPDEKQRVRRTMGMLGMCQFRAEGRPLLASILPITLVATWAFSRLGFFPPADNEPVRVNAYTTLSAIGEPVHLVPMDGVHAEDGWLQRVRPVVETDLGWGLYEGMASWTLRAEGRPEPYRLAIRCAGQTHTLSLLAGQRRYMSPLAPAAGDAVQMLTVDLREYRPLGIVPGFPALFLQPWVVGYLLLVIPLSLLMKRITNTA